MPTETPDIEEQDTPLTPFELAFDAASTTTEPVVAEPVVPAEPAVTEPVVTEPVVAEPVATEPVVTEPAVAEPAVAEPVVAEPVVAEPVVVAPVVPESVVAAAPVIPEPVAPEEYQFTPEEQTVLDAAFGLYPEIKDAMALMVKKITESRNASRAFELAGVAGQIAKQFAPALTEAQMSVQSRWEQQVLAAHPDARTILPQVEEWIKKQPSILQPAYNRVLDGSTPQETIELLSLAKKDLAPAIPVAPAPPAVDVTKEAQLESLEGVRSRATSKTGVHIDPNDFESAFQQAAGNS